MAEIQLRNLGKRWGSFVGVDNFDLTIADRELLVLLDPSGCSKTTTMRMIAGLEGATEGDILVEGRRVNGLEPKDRDVAMVFLSYALYPNMNVYENIRFQLKVRGTDPKTYDEKVRRASAMVKLDEFLHRKPAELSGGLRVALARAIVREPNVFPSDEPLSNLAAKLRVSTRAQIKNLSHELAALWSALRRTRIPARKSETWSRSKFCKNTAIFLTQQQEHVSETDSGTIAAIAVQQRANIMHALNKTGRKIMHLKTLVLTGVLSGLMGSATFAADCGPAGQSIRILASDFPAIHAVAGNAETNCGSSAAEFTRNHTTEARQIMNAALTPNPAEYTSVIVANSTLTQLMNDGLVRPLNDLVDKYGDNIADNLKITIDGDVMAVAFMANSQHLFSRTDILAKAGIDSVPGTYDEMIAAAKAVREAGIMEYPIVMNMKTGWNVGESFNLIFLAHGGEFFKLGSAEPSVNSEAGIAALETMKALVEYAHPDHLTQASNETQALWEAGQAALGIMWGSRGATILDDEGSTEQVTSNTVLSAAPSVKPGGIPGATLWWDGFTISANISDDEAEATFAALASAMTSEMVAANNDDAVWLLDGFKPGAAAAGVSATAQGGAAPYPMLPQIGLLHNALGAELSDFLKGEESAEQALADVEAAYITSAKEAGFLQ